MAAVIVLGFPNAGEQAGLLFYAKPDIAGRILSVPANLCSHSSINTRFRINRHIQLSIRPPVNVQKKWLACLPDMGTDRLRNLPNGGGADINNRLVRVAGVKD